MMWQRHRLNLLALTCASVVLSLGWSVLSPTAANRQVKPFQFPETVPLPEWQMTARQDLGSETSAAATGDDRVEAAQRYVYRSVAQPQGAFTEQPLTIEMYYLVGTRGRVEVLVRDIANIDPAGTQPWVIREQPAGAAYSLFVSSDRAYLSTCINSRGGSTVTHEAFSLKRDRDDLQWRSLIPWILGHSSLRDRRCLWTHLSIPVENSEPESAYEQLETVWQDWYAWWQPRFPAIQ